MNRVITHRPINLNDADRERMMAHVKATLCPISPEQRDHSYQQWIHGGRGWDVLQEGGTGILRVLYWYHHVHRPGSNEWRPATILKALYKASLPTEQPT